MAARSLKRRRMRSVLTISGIAVGVMLIVALASISESLNGAVDEAATQIPSGELPELRKASDFVNMLLAGLGGVSMLIAGLGIMNTMMIAVAERKREIGIMKAIGAAKARIMRIFLFESMLQGITGGVAGCFSGFTLTKVASVFLSAWFTAEVSIPVSFRSLSSAFAVAVISAIVWGAYPSWRASSLRPVEALRNE